METVPRHGQRVYLTGTETTAELIALGACSKEQRWRCRKTGYFSLSRKPHYPQREGPGGFQVLGNPYHFVKAIVFHEVNTTVMPIDDDTVEDWIQEAIAECWLRRHAPWVAHFTSYYYSTVRGLVRQWIVRYRREASRHIPLHTRRAA